MRRETCSKGLHSFSTRSIGAQPYQNAAVRQNAAGVIEAVGLCPIR
jgi:hypothetical protein